MTTELKWTELEMITNIQWLLLLSTILTVDDRVHRDMQAKLSYCSHKNSPCSSLENLEFLETFQQTKSYHTYIVRPLLAKSILFYFCISHVYPLTNMNFVNGQQASENRTTIRYSLFKFCC